MEHVAFSDALGEKCSMSSSYCRDPGWVKDNKEFENEVKLQVIWAAVTGDEVEFLACTVTAKSTIPSGRRTRDMEVIGV